MTRSDLSGPEVRQVESIVIGSGVAGLSCALELGRGVLLTDGALGVGGSTPLAQGGIAAAIDVADSPRSHGLDTIAVSAGLADRSVVETVTDAGPAAIEALLGWGAEFDRSESGRLCLGREAGHSARRIVHANGDATGAEIAGSLVSAVRARPGIEVIEKTRAVDLVRVGGRIGGVLAVGERGRLLVLLSSVVVVAGGGYGHCFERTTTPRSVIGSGIAMAVRAGAAVADMEFVQFHPTALAVEAVDRLPLLTEALRGEGATLIDERGHRYLVDEHPDAELAPRDVVARANYRQLAAGRRVFLDARGAVGDSFPERFPTVFELARRHGLDPRIEPLPVVPAAHYCMGGIAVDVDGGSSIEGLWAIGEAASTGLHGANRLASNSLLEGLVMGIRAARSIRCSGATSRSMPSAMSSHDSEPLLVPGDIPLRVDERGGMTVDASWLTADEGFERNIRNVLWNAAGVERDLEGLRAGLRGLNQLEPSAGATQRSSTMHLVSSMVVRAAMRRTESRGAHYRLDHPEPNPAEASRLLDRREPPAAHKLHWISLLTMSSCRPTAVLTAMAASTAPPAIPSEPRARSRTDSGNTLTMAAMPTTGASNPST